MEQIPDPTGTHTSWISPEQWQLVEIAAVDKSEPYLSEAIDESPLPEITAFLLETLAAYSIRVTEWQRIWLERWVTATADPPKGLGD